MTLQRVVKKICTVQYCAILINNYVTAPIRMTILFDRIAALVREQLGIIVTNPSDTRGVFRNMTRRISK